MALLAITDYLSLNMDVASPAMTDADRTVLWLACRVLRTRMDTLEVHLEVERAVRRAYRVSGATPPDASRILYGPGSVDPVRLWP
ncbi:hypothetical protein GY21_08240 [Cryobacterium roopkundense]|nr:hypothetical protein GY21_08240 [Cryobacterium roopkundense]